MQSITDYRVVNDWFYITIAAIIGLGFDKFTTVLTYHKGSYSSFDLTM